MIGIYCITNKSNHKKYVGSSIKIKARWIDHKARLRGGTHRNEYLQRAWNKYSEQFFEFTILEQCPIESLEAREQHWMAFLGTLVRRKGYNLSHKCERKEVIAEETRKKHSESAKKQWQTQRQEMIAALRDSWNKNRSRRLSGAKKSGETRRDGRPVEEYNLDGTLSRTYSNRREAFLKNTSNRNIYRVLSGEQKSSKGKIYKYKESPSD